MLFSRLCIIFHWRLWRYNPALEEEGKNPFQLDNKEPN